MLEAHAGSLGRLMSILLYQKFREITVDSQNILYAMGLCPIYVQHVIIEIV